MNIMDRYVILQTDNGYVLKGIYSDFCQEFISASDALQYVVDQTKGSVEFGDGEFRFDKAVLITRTITITGNGRNTRLLVNCGKGIHFFKSHGSLIEKLSFIGEKDGLMGIHIQTSGDLKVVDCCFTGFKKYGVWISDSSFLCDIRGCSFAGNEDIHIYCSNLCTGEYGDFITNMISNCHIYGGGKGIELDNSIVMNLVGVCVYQTKQSAFRILNDSNSVVLSGCRTFQITGDAVYVYNSHELNITGNIFCWHTGNGITVEKCSWGTITGNNVIDNGSYNNNSTNFTTRFADVKEVIPNTFGIQLTGTEGYNVTGNSIFNWGVAPKMDCGIYEDKESSTNVFTSNNVNYYSNYAVASMGKGSVATSNIGYADEAYHAMGELMQTFNTNWTDCFIEKLKSGKYDLTPSCGQALEKPRLQSVFIPPINPHE